MQLSSNQAKQSNDEEYEKCYAENQELKLFEGLVKPFQWISPFGAAYECRNLGGRAETMVATNDLGCQVSLHKMEDSFTA